MDSVKVEVSSSMMTMDTKVIQVTNVAPAATLEQMSTLFGYLGKIDEIKLYPSEDYPIQPSSRICYVKYSDSMSVGVAQHLTNTVFIDRALIVVPVVDGKILDENTALALATPTPLVPGLLCSGSTLVNQITGIGSNQVVNTNDPQLTVLGLPQYPSLTGNVDLNKVEEIRRTVQISNLDPEVTAEQLLKAFNQIGEVKYVRMAGEEGQDTQHAFVEFTEQTSVSKALQCNGTMVGTRPIKVCHSSMAIAKPQAKSSEAAQREIEEAMKRVREAQSLITAAIDPGIAAIFAELSETKDKKKSRSRSHSPHRRSTSRSKRSHSRSRRSRSRSRGRSKSSRSPKAKRRSRSRSRKRSHSPKRPDVKSKDRKSRSKSRDGKSKISPSPKRKGKSRSRSSLVTGESVAKNLTNPTLCHRDRSSRRRSSRKSRSRSPAPSRKSDKSSSKSSRSSRESRRSKEKSPKKSDNKSKEDKEPIKEEVTAVTPEVGPTEKAEDQQGDSNAVIAMDTVATLGEMGPKPPEATALAQEPREETAIKQEVETGDGSPRDEENPQWEERKPEKEDSEGKDGSPEPDGDKTPVKERSLTPKHDSERSKDKKSTKSRSPSRHSSSKTKSPRRKRSRSTSRRRKSRSLSPRRRSPKRRSRSPPRKRSSPIKMRSPRRKSRSPRKRSPSPRRSHGRRSPRRSPIRRRSRSPRRRSRTPKRRSRSRSRSYKRDSYSSKHKKKKDRDRSRERDRKKKGGDKKSAKITRDYDEEEKGFYSSGDEKTGKKEAASSSPKSPKKTDSEERSDSDRHSQLMDLDSD